MKGGTGRWTSLLSQKLRNADGSMNWRLVGAATYATAVWSLIGMVAFAYKIGYLTYNKVEKIETKVDRKERSRIVAEDVAEYKYTPENFIG